MTDQAYDREADIASAWMTVCLLRRAMQHAGAGRLDAKIERETLELVTNAVFELEDRLTAIYRSTP